MLRLEPQITFRNLSPSEAMQAAVRKGIDHIDSLFGKGISSYGIVIWVPHRHHHKGILYFVRINITTVTGKTIVTRKSNEDPYLAIKDGLLAARRHVVDGFRRKRSYYGHHNSWEEPHAA